MAYKDPEVRKAYHRAWKRAYRAAHPEYNRLHCRAYRATHLEEKRAKNRAWYASLTPEQKNRDREKRLARRQANREEYRRRWREGYARNKASVQRHNEAYRRRHPEIAQAIIQRRRTRKLQAAINDFTAQQWKAMQEAADHRCHYCHKRIKGKLEQDHIIPLSKGGNHTLSNIVPACRSCNAQKFTGPPPVPVQPFLLL